jgi:hypothetical protein
LLNFLLWQQSEGRKCGKIQNLENSGGKIFESWRHCKLFEF